MKDSKTVEITRTESLIILSLLEEKTRDQIIAERDITKATWYNHVTAIRGKLTGGWRDEIMVQKPLNMIQQILEDIEAAVKEGKNPLIQSDVISSRAMMRVVIHMGHCYPCDAQVSQALHRFGMVSVGRWLCVGERHYLWALPEIDRNEAVRRICARLIK